MDNKMDKMSEMIYCQSCAMPLTEEGQHGTEADGGKSQDYCSYCYEKGSFTSDMTMEEMIEVCVPPMVEHNKDMTEEEARAGMQQFFPQLKRWKK